MENNLQNICHEIILPDYIKRQRWFLNKTAVIKDIKFKDFWKNDIYISSLLDIRYENKSKETYFFPFVMYGKKIGEISENKGYYRALFSCLNLSRKIKTKKGYVFFKGLKKLSLPQQVKVYAGELSNTITFVQKEYVVKIFRKQQSGINPELELLLKLKKNVPEIVGYISYREKNRKEYIIAIVEKYIPSVSDVWEYLLKTGFNNFSKDVDKLANVIAGLHNELASVFGLEIMKEEDKRKWYFQFSQNLERVLNISKGYVKNWLLKNKTKILDYGKKIFEIRDFGKKIRIHGDLHLGQILKTDNSFCVIDFQGEPLKSYEKIRQKQSPLKDVAGMLRSFAYAGYVRKEKGMGLKDKFLKNYILCVKAKHMDFLPKDENSLKVIVSLFELEKAIYELEYEMNARPLWVNIPLEGIKTHITCL